MKNCLLLIFTFISLSIFGQNSTTTKSKGTTLFGIELKNSKHGVIWDPLNYNYEGDVVTGAMLGLHGNIYPMIELGYFRYKAPEAFVYAQGMNMSVEAYFIKEPILAPKLSFWYHVFIYNLGVSIPYYFNMNGESSLRIRPEIGFGIFRFKATYSANIAITNKDMDHVGSHFLSLIYYIPVW